MLSFYNGRGGFVIAALAAAFTSLPLDAWDLRLPLHGSDTKHRPQRIERNTTAGMRFNASSRFRRVEARCPSYDNDIGALTFALYPWAGDVVSSTAVEPIVVRRFKDFRNNAVLALEFDPLPPGDYYAELSDGEEVVGVWRTESANAGAEAYLNGARVNGAYSFVVTLVDQSDPYAATPELVTLLRGETLAPTASDGVSDENGVTIGGRKFVERDLYADTWDAVDGLGRVLSSRLSLPRDRQIGIFYWTWHEGDKTEASLVCNNAEILAADPTFVERPEDPVWGQYPKCISHHWDEPLFGYYRTDDAWVSRRHAQLLVHAGVDTVVFDATNGRRTWMKSFLTLARTWSAMRRDGVRTPQTAFMLPFGENVNQVVSILQLYRDMYRPGLYRELWFYWKGRPLIHANPSVIYRVACDSETPEADRRDLREVLRFFSFRPVQPEYAKGPTAPDQWSWLEAYPQHGFGPKADGRCEMVAAGVAQNHSWLKGDGGQGLAAMNDINVFGRAYVGPDEKHLRSGEKLRFASDRNPRRNEPNRFLWGDNFSQQLMHAISLDPEYIFITGWNEWVAGYFTEWEGKKWAFPDQYSPAYSRDIEPSKGILKDCFYYQFVQGCRRFLGARPQRSLDDSPVFRDAQGDVDHRDAIGYGGKRYRNDSGRNDFVEASVERDQTTVRFKVKCAKAITPCTDPRWMRLFLSLGLKQDGARPNWNCFNYVVNRLPPPNSHTAILEECTGGWNWRKLAEVLMRVEGDTLTLEIPRAAIGQTDRIDFRFKWADNTPGDNGEILDFYTDGDVAPDARFLYHAFEQMKTDKGNRR